MLLMMMELTVDLAVLLMEMVIGCGVEVALTARELVEHAQQLGHEIRCCPWNQRERKGAG